MLDTCQGQLFADKPSRLVLLERELGMTVQVATKVDGVHGVIWGLLRLWAVVGLLV